MKACVHSSPFGRQRISRLLARPDGSSQQTAAAGTLLPEFEGLGLLQAEVHSCWQESARQAADRGIHH